MAASPQLLPAVEAITPLARLASDVQARPGSAWLTPVVAAAEWDTPASQPAVPLHHSSHHLQPHERLRKVVGIDRHEYLAGLGGLGPAARPASLQPLLKQGRCTPSSLCLPHLDATALSFADFQLGRSGRLAPEGSLRQCCLTLGAAAGLPSATLADRASWLSVARLCLYDGARFHGNVQAIKPRKIKTAKNGSATWKFDPAPVLVRCPPHLVHTMQVYIEFCVSYELLASEAQRLPARPGSAARLCDELCIAYALVDLSTLSTLHSARSLRLPLGGGPLSRRHTLRQCYAAAAAVSARSDPMQPQPAAHQLPGRGGVFSTAVEPLLTVRLAPVPAKDADVAALLPPAAVAPVAVAQVVALYRMLLADALAVAQDGAPPASSCTVADHVLAAFPDILNDPDLSNAFFKLWQQHTAPRVKPSTLELKQLLRRCVTLVWALMGSQAIPPPTIANCCAHQWERSQRMQQYAQLHPVDGLGSTASAWMHRPFDARELVVAGLPAAAAKVAA